ncbi:M3 family metallopeptidase [Reichenbachiella ulvae]|uniref:Zn-dependent oligopeptidase n=1 Tax=Reichenbachiella ulvae TaxID=2980104 RepID=A0ABT3CSR9_9BACT|nr:M3 family metallopeptidase [Reichenbachiella ulvae]MCV9386751.1 Zn-dependent oligopeptidase [Reichenbachiella ulvae]
MRTLLSLCLVISICASCTTETQKPALEMSTDNPFNVALNEPIAYADVSADDVEEYVAVSMDQAIRGIENIKSADPLSFENTFAAFDKISTLLGKTSSIAHMMFWVSTDSLTRAKGSAGDLKIDSLRTEIYSDKELFNQFQSFAESEEGKAIEGPRFRLMDQVINRFEQSGVKLNDQELARYKTLSAEISELTTQYSTHMNSADEVIILKENQIAGLPEMFIEKFRTDSGNYVVPVNNANTSSIMGNADLSEVRKAYAIKKANIAADKNLVILDSLISKRHQLAQLMGAESYATYSLKPKMAKTPENVWTFINDLADETKAKAVQDLEVLKTYRNSKQNTPGDDSPIQPWDLSYYHNQLLKSEYKVDHEKMREYFSLDPSLKGMLELYQELLGLEFRKVENASVWHEDVSIYEVFENDSLKGQFYLDLFPRPNKETWFYCVPLISGNQTPEGYEVPVAMLLGNFTKPTDKLPSLLTFSEMNTLYHEFGHIVNSMAYEGEYGSLDNPKADFVESMSQIFENWIEDYDILSSFARHYETGEVFPKKLFDNKQRAKNLSSGLSAQRSIRYCKYDMNLYDRFDPNSPMDTDQLWKDIDEEMGVMDRHIEGTHPQASWIHINTHPVYMYGYLWSEVYAQDMFTEFEKNGLRDTETGIRYRKLILANGNQRDIEEAVEEFLGRPSNNQAYIKSLGLE